MDTSTTLAVNILVRTSMGAAQNQWSKAIDRMERDVRSFVNRVNKMFASIKYPTGGAGSSRGGGVTGGGASPAGSSRSRSFQAQGPYSLIAEGNTRRKLEENLTASFADQSNKRVQIVQNETKKHTNAVANSVETQKKHYKSLTQHSYFSGVFWTTFAAMVTANLVNSVVRIPQMIRRALDEAVKIASERQNALLGVTSVSRAKGVDTQATLEAVKSLRLVKAGIVDVAEASTAMKNLLASNFNLQEATALLEAFSDTAAFGKQAALDFGEAIRGASEGIKNGNSILVDNVGLTKNLSIILKEAGFAESDLMRATTDANVRRALYNGLLKEASINLGDADRLTQTYTGSVANLDLAQKNLYAAVGNNIIQNKSLLESNKIIAEQLNEYANNTNTAGSETRKFVTEATNLYAELKASAISTFASAATAIASMVTAMAAGLGAVVTLTVAPFEAIISGVEWLVAQAMLKLSNLSNWLVDTFGVGLLTAVGLPTLKIDTSSMERKMRDFNFMPISKEIADATGNLLLATRDLFNMSNRFGAEAAAAERRVRVARYTGENPLQPTNPFGRSQTARELFTPWARDEKGNLIDPKVTGAIDPKTGLFMVRPKTTTPVFGAPGTGGGANKKSVADSLPQFGSMSNLVISSGNAQWDAWFNEMGRKYNVDPNVLLLQAKKESSFNPTAVSPKGAKGISQFTPGTAARFGLANPFDVQSSIEAQAQYMAWLGSQPYIGGDYRLMLAGYNAGEGAVQKFGKVPPYRETQNYVNTIEGWYRAQVRKDGRTFGTFNPEDVFPFDPEVAARLRAITTTGGARGRTIEDVGPSTVNQHFVTQFEERINALVMRQVKLREEINTHIEDYVVSLLEAVEQNKVDLALAKARLPMIEAENAYQASRATQTNMVKDAERDIAMLRKQNADDAFVAQRRYLMAKDEELQIEREITGMQDRLATQGMNSNLEIQLRLLQDIYDIRQREYDAVMDINRAQLEISQQTVYSANEANARVLQFMASQTNVSDAMADFKIGLMESGYDLIDKGLDRLLPKMGRLSSAVKDLLSSFIRLALNVAFRKLFGLEAAGSIGGVQAGMGGGASGIGGMLSQILTGSRGGSGSGGGGATVATTPMFNPNILPTRGGTIDFGRLISPEGRAAGGIDFGSVLNPSGAPVASRTLTGGQLGAVGLSGAAGGVGKGTKPLISATLMNQLMGAFTGGMLGAGLGQGSGVGTGLGMAGGAIAGTLLMGLMGGGGISGAVTGGIFGKTAGLFGLGGAATFGIGLAIAGGLMLFSWLFGRSARRKREKREVERLSGDVVAKIQQLIADVKAFKIDGSTAYSQGVELRDQYQEEIKKLTTKPGKALARSKLAQINSLLATLKTEGDNADRIRLIASETDKSLIPTFHSGGFGFSTGIGYGQSLSVVKSHEAVLTQQNIMALGGYRALQEAGVRGISNQPYENITRTKTSGAPDTTIVVVMDDDAADEIIKRASVSGIAKKVRVSMRDNIEGVFTQTEKKLMGR